MKKLDLFTVRLVLLSFAFPSFGFGISMNFTGTMRSQAAFFSKLNQEIAGRMPTKQYIKSRILLEPNLVVDDHFAIKSQWNLLSSPTLTPNASTALGTGQGDYVFGDPNTSSLNLGRAWLEWTSDFGVVRIGRMPVSWGYGLMWDAGNGVWDTWQTTYDRLEYRLHLGHVVGALAYSKPRKLSVEAHTDDADFYTIYLQYENPEADVEAGILYEKQTRSLGQERDYVGTASSNPSPNPYKLPATYANKYPLDTKTPYPKDNNVLNVYLKKSFGYFTLGGEVGWITGNAFDFNQNGVKDELNAYAAVFNVAFEYHKVRLFNEFVYASGDASLSDNLRGFTLLHRNKSPGFIFGKELIGQYAGNGVDLASPVVYGNTGSFSGVYYLRPGFRVDWSPSWASGLEVVWAQKAAKQAGEEGHLATEFDLGTDYNVYKNFDLGLTLGLCLPGKGIPLPAGMERKAIFGVRSTASLKF